MYDLKMICQEHLLLHIYTHSHQRIELINLYSFSFYRSFYYSLILLQTFLGPLTCGVTNRYGFRIVGIMGGVISCLAFLLSTLILNLHAFLIFMGVLCGISFNMIYMPCVLIVGFYFEKWRALATAIALCGSSLGVIAFPPMVTSLMKDLHWTWKFRILSGLTLLTSVCAFTFRPIRPISVVDENRPEKDLESVYSLNIDRDKRHSKPMFKTYHNMMFPTASEYHDATSIYTLSRRPSANPIGSDPSITKSTFIYKTDNQSMSLSTVYELEDEVKKKRTIKSYCRRIFRCCPTNICKRKGGSTFADNANRPLYRDDIFYTGSIYLLPEYSRATVAAGPSKVSRLINNNNHASGSANIFPLDYFNNC